MTTKDQLTASLSHAVWDLLRAKGVVGMRKPTSVGEVATNTLKPAALDALLSNALISNPVDTRAQLEADGYTAEALVLEVLEVPDIPENRQTQDGFEFSAIEGLTQYLTTRLTASLTGGVQQRLNSSHGLWLVSYRPKTAARSLLDPRYGATGNADLIRELHTIPTMQRQVGMQLRVAQTALTVWHRVPAAAAASIAAMDIKVLAHQAVRARNYDLVTAELTSTQRAELDAAIDAEVSVFAGITAPKMAEIKAAEPVTSKGAESDDEMFSDH